MPLRVQDDKEYRKRFPDNWYMLNKLVGISDSQEVICMGYYDDLIKKQREEYFAVPFKEEMHKNVDLHINFKYLSPCGVFELYTNSIPSLRGAYHIDDLIVEKKRKSLMPYDSALKYLLEYEKSFEFTKKQKEHNWLIIRINHKKEIELNYGSSITFINPDIRFDYSTITDTNILVINKPINFNFHFKSGSSEILSYDTLNFYNLIEEIKVQKDLKISIHGHTDNVGDPVKNQKLSKLRAEKVYQLFLFEGISLERVEFKGFGESKPIAKNATKGEQSLNRRVEVIVH